MLVDLTPPNMRMKTPVPPPQVVRALVGPTETRLLLEGELAHLKTPNVLVNRAPPWWLAEARSFRRVGST